ncbi:hypothetical protein G7Z17_g2157 [Cylindrodendrum hubeiense]|uniref:Glutamate-1-semialdehyde 2,1-aminomutase n=1 Tax=Cylindrodendrum hubeiense TaxID=595255 RepID=A0A9P5HIA0_9HYPO|nr:hypothetical protein G7Z17_g2157 [Cylindrodendrum hubeiense]
MKLMDSHKNEPRAEVVQDVKNYPALVRHGAGVFSEFIGSIPGSVAPLMLGIWNADDLDHNDVIFEPETDEVKYIISDGAEYLDCVSEYSAAMFGHSNPKILAAIQEAMNRGINLGGPGNDEVALAHSIKDRFRSIAKVRFCNSGSEANTMALALATHVTKKKKILAFENGYHGGFIQFDSNPSPTTIPHDFVLGRFNDIEYTRSLLSDEIAAIIVEPMQGAGGVSVATKAFLQFLRDAATKHKALLIFDEVVTSRLHINGLQGYFEVYPDLTTLGKYIGGGPSFGAFGGLVEVMEALDPKHSSPIHHSGTYNNNVFTMAAGVAAAKILTKEKISKANSLGDKVRDGINSAMKDYNTQLIEASGMGSMVGVRFSGPAQARLRDCLFFYMLSRGVYMGKRGFVSLNLTHEEKHIDQLLDSFYAFAQEVFGNCKWMK